MMQAITAVGLRTRASLVRSASGFAPSAPKSPNVSTPTLQTIKMPAKKAETKPAKQDAKKLGTDKPAKGGKKESK